MADLKTTFAPDKSMVVSTPGASAPAFPELTPDLINALMGRRAAASSPAPGMVNRGRRPSGGGFAPSYTPSMGAAQAAAPTSKAKTITRMRKLMGTQDPNAVSGFIGDWGGRASKALNPGTMVQEELLPDGSWSLDAVYGSIGGNEEAARAHQQNVYRIGGGASAGLPMDWRMPSQIETSRSGSKG